MRSYSIALAALVAVGACKKSEPAPTPAPTSAPSRPTTTTTPTRPPAPRPDTTGRPPVPRPDSTGAPTTPPVLPNFPGAGGAPGEPNPRPYASVITPRAKSKTGIFGVHQVGSSL